MNGADVRKVLRSAGSKLSGDEIVLRNKERLKAGRRINHPFNPTLPCTVKINAGEIGENIETSRVASKTKEAVSIFEFLWTNALNRHSKLCKSGICRLSISGVRFYEEIEVLCKSGLRVKDYRVTANDQVPNAMGMEGGQKVFVVLVHPAESPNL